MREWLSDGLLMVGASLALLASIGVVRMPDVFTRMHTIRTPIRSMATTRSGSVGPFSSLRNVKQAAAASMVNATRDGVLSAPMFDTQPRTPSTRRSKPILISLRAASGVVMYMTWT